MKFKELFDNIFSEERECGKFNGFQVDIGEDEGEFIPHFHLKRVQNNDKTAIRLDMPYYFLHGDKKYILNSKERKFLVAWLNSKPTSTKNLGKNDELPKNNWESLKNAWNNNSPDAIINCEQPNYNLLEKDYKDAN